MNPTACGRSGSPRRTSTTSEARCRKSGGCAWITKPTEKPTKFSRDLAYDNFAYKHSTMGSMADLNAASLADVAQFFKTYYAPNNAVLSLVGDFKTPEALAKIKKYFEDIPSQPAPPSVDMSEPAQTAERRTVVEDSFARLPRLDIVYKTVPANTPDWYALDMLGDILFGGTSSRLYQKLVKEKAVALQVAGGIDLRRGPVAVSGLCTAEARAGSGRGRETDLRRVRTRENRRSNPRGNGKDAHTGPAATGRIPQEYSQSRANSWAETRCTSTTRI